MSSPGNSPNSTSTSTTTSSSPSSTKVSVKSRLSSLFSQESKKSKSDPVTLASYRSSLPVSSISLSNASTLSNSCSPTSVLYESSEGDTLLESVSSSLDATVPEVTNLQPVFSPSSPVSTIAVAVNLDSHPVSLPVGPVAGNLVQTTQSVSFSPAVTAAEALLHSSQIVYPSSAAVSSVLSPTSPPIYSPSMNDFSPITSSTKCTSPTSSLIDSYRLTALISPTTCIDTTQTQSTFSLSPQCVSSVAAKPASYSQLVDNLLSETTTQTDSQHLSTSSQTQQIFTNSSPVVGFANQSNATTPLSEIGTLHLFNPPTSNQGEVTVNPVGLQSILQSMVSNIDALSAKCDQLDSLTHIMQNSMYTALSEKIDNKLAELMVPPAESDSKFENLKADLDSKVESVLLDNAEMRKVWDLHMGGIRRRVSRACDDSTLSDDEEEESSCESPPTPYEIRLTKLNAEIMHLKDEFYKLDCRVVETEQYPRRESLDLNGIPGNVPQKDLEFTVFHILEHLGFHELRRDDICAVHRLWSHPNSRDPAPVIVRFMNRKIVQWSLEHTGNLKRVKDAMGLNITLSESICAKNTESFKICKWLKDQGSIHDYFSRNGFPKVVLERGSRPVKIAHPEMLRQRFENIPTFTNNT